MKFRDDIDPAKTWIVSDTHFGHENIVGYCHRPLDHDQVMIAEWRAHIPDDATVLHLGDLVYTGNARFKHITAKELTGQRKLLIKGNHDHQRFSFYKACGFSIVSPFAILYGNSEIKYRQVCLDCDGRINTRNDDSPPVCKTCRGWGSTNKSVPWTVSFSHYPWSEKVEGRPMLATDLRLHGHIHNNGYTRDGFVPFLKQHINLSVEQTKYRPVNLKLLLDSVLLGEYPETTEEQHREVRDRKAGIR